MIFSRLRLRLAGVFALTLALALLLVATASLGWLWRESSRRLDARVARIAVSVEEAIGRERAETPDSSLVFALDEVRRDWVWSVDQWIVLDDSARVITTLATPATTARVLDAQRTAHADRFVSELDGDDLRGVVRRVTAAGRVPAYTIVAFASSEGVERDIEQLAIALGIAMPLIVVVSIAGGYFLARRALTPVNSLGVALEAIHPNDLSARVPTSATPDEIDHLALRFNALLERLESAQAQNRRFVEEAAHQIRTPLTLVRGEADLALSAVDRPSSELMATLARIRTASEQMQRRVNELMLLAEAETGVQIERRERIELDVFAADTTDLFRARAAQLGRSLALGELAPLAVRGSSALLREALMELLENACRHGAPGQPVEISVRQREVMAELCVQSGDAAAGHALAGSAATNDAPRGGVGHRIVRWIAEGHGGGFTVSRTTGDSSMATYLAIISVPIDTGDLPTSRAKP